MTDAMLRIVILGGGTAGWMAANMIANRWRDRAQITVIESSDIGTVGVGEGSTPQMKRFFDALGIAEEEWMPRCNATFKNGIRFNGWSSQPGFRTYFHPFRGDLDQFTMPTFYKNTVTRRQGVAVPCHPDHFSIQTYLAGKKLAPRAPEHFPFTLLYGYHFDASLLGRFLREHATGLGVRHLDRKVVEAVVGENGNVTHLTLEGGQEIAGDLFIDASGFRSFILQEKLGTRFIPFADNLFNDSAVVFPTYPHSEAVECQTVATTLKCGWAWKIPLTNRYGNGYVYSSRYCSAEEAEAEFRSHLGVPDELEARHLKMKVGKTEEAWIGNCLAIGLAQSFIEPLEATALMVVQRTVEQFMRAFEKGGLTPRERASYNKEIGELCESVRDYIVCHYKVNGRTDTEYWRDNAANTHLSDRLRSMLEAWFAAKELRPLIRQQASSGGWGELPWHSLLAGYGCFPPHAKLRPAPMAAKRELARVQSFIRRCSLNFEDHAALLHRFGGRSEQIKDPHALAAE